MSVYSFKPRQYDPPQFVAEDLDDLAGLLDGFVGAGQCDGCGNASYRVVLHGGSYYAKCEVDPTDDEEFRHPEPCGKEWLIRLTSEDETAF